MEMTNSREHPGTVCGSCRHLKSDHGDKGKCEGVGCWCTKFWAEAADGPDKDDKYAGGHLSEKAST